MRFWLTQRRQKDIVFGLKKKKEWWTYNAIKVDGCVVIFLMD
jgi:hypothetical protein